MSDLLFTKDEVITTFKVCMALRDDGYVRKIFNIVGKDVYETGSHSTGGHYGKSDFHITAYVPGTHRQLGISIYKGSYNIQVFYNSISTTYVPGGPGVEGEKRLKKLLALAEYAESIKEPSEYVYMVAKSNFIHFFNQVRDKYLHGAMTLEQVKNLYELQQSIGGAL